MKIMVQPLQTKQANSGALPRSAFFFWEEKLQLSLMIPF